MMEAVTDCKRPSWKVIDVTPSDLRSIREKRAVEACFLELKIFLRKRRRKAIRASLS